MKIYEMHEKYFAYSKNTLKHILEVNSKNVVKLR